MAKNITTPPLAPWVPAIGGVYQMQTYEEALAQACGDLGVLLLKLPAGTQCEITRLTWDQDPYGPTLQVTVIEGDDSGGSKPKRFWWKWPQ